MAGFNDFAPGQRVAHITMGDGTVIAVDGGRVNCTPPIYFTAAKKGQTHD